jgi:hypothetical protein
MWEAASFSFAFAQKEAARRKFHFILAFCSVFLVVVSTLVINQIISKGSIIFLKISESTHGEIDAFVTPSSDIIGQTSDGIEYEMGSLLNFTAVNEKYNKDSEGLKVLENLKLAPRKVFTGVKVLREGRSGLYNETSTLQQEKWH